MSDRLNEALVALSSVYSGWILWNLFLAFIPLALSYWLFRRKKPTRTFAWWFCFALFVAFLPNAPYMLTDIIHLVRGADRASIWLVTLFVLPVHLLAILGGLMAYVLSLLNLDIYLKRQGLERLIPAAELGMHLLCAVGIYLGRFRRLNSWDIAVNPGDVVLTTLDDLTSKRPVLVMFITFIVLTVFYWVFKQITLGLMLRIRYARMGRDILE